MIVGDIGQLEALKSAPNIARVVACSRYSGCLAGFDGLPARDLSLYDEMLTIRLYPLYVFFD